MIDPFLAKLPCSDKMWRVGHYKRDYPAGFQESIKTGENLIKDQKLAKFYNKIQYITKKNLFSKKRFKIILAMNLGKYDKLLNKIPRIKTNFYAELNRGNFQSFGKHLSDFYQRNIK